MPKEVFQVKPYLQLGNNPHLLSAENVTVVWHTEDGDGQDQHWTAWVRQMPGLPWRQSESLSYQIIDVATVARHRVYRAVLSQLNPGESFQYQLRLSDEAVFEARGTARKARGQDYRVVVVGDCGWGGPGQASLAYQIYQWQPDLLVVPGDIVYMLGRIVEYRENLFPYYNANVPSEDTGAPLLRSTLMLGGLGEHDTGSPDIDQYPDSLAYYMYWSFPLNGPRLDVDGPNTFALNGNPENKARSLAAAGTNYPRMASYGFDFGNSHWTMLDTNPHVNWLDPDMRMWLKADLDSAQAADWRFVCSYMPPFNPSLDYPDAQRMRIAIDLFQEGDVQIVFSGYVHSYHRTLPLKFTSPGIVGGDFNSYRVKIDGEFEFDSTFDGHKETRPSGIVYLTTGAGGAALHNVDQTYLPSTWQPYTERFVANIHSATVLDIKGKSLTVRQMTQNGDEIDHIELNQ